MLDRGMINKIKLLPIGEQRKMLELLELYEEAQKREEASKDFIKFAQAMWPGMIVGRHHRLMANAFERVAQGKLRRLIINMAPRFGKSEMGSYLLPAWYMGLFPDRKIIQATHTADLSHNFGRKVRNLIDSKDYKEIFPETSLRADSKAAGRWNTSKGGDYNAVGVGAALAGKGADLCIIDDPVSEQEAITGAHNANVYESSWEWFLTGPRQRLQPSTGSIVIIMCMTGDTQVLMADGSHKALCDVRPGDEVATYENGQIATSKIANWRSSGVDDVLKVQTRSGRIIRANARHPFLVDTNGGRQWVRLSNLKPGMQLVALTAVSDLPGRNGGRDCATPVKQMPHIIEGTQRQCIDQSDIEGSGGKNPAAVGSLLAARGFAFRAIVASTPARQSLQSAAAPTASSLGTASLRLTTTRSSPPKMVDALSATSIHRLPTRGLIGTESSVSTTVMTRGVSVGCSATTATLLSATGKPQTSSVEPLNIYGVGLDEIVSITRDGREEVFDVEVERTENFIANGVVSHNTRWAKNDLTGKIIEQAIANDELGEWEVIEFPAILPSGTSLWPEFWPLSELESLRRQLPINRWQAQYMQKPTSEEGAIIKRDWWKRWNDERGPLPYMDAIIVSWDTAYEKTQRADYSAYTVWGVFTGQSKEDVRAGIIDKDRKPNVMLMHAEKGKWEFPDLKKKAIEVYNKWKPDQYIVEAKAAGAPLVFEMRALGMPVQEFKPTRGNDKVVRANAVADLFSSGVIWAPDRKWADEVIEETAEFPYGQHDDYVDTLTQALLRIRQGGYVRVQTDDEIKDEVDLGVIEQGGYY